MTIRPAIIAPTYNNSATVLNVLQDAAKLGHHVFVVNDGSTDATAELLESFAGEHRQNTTILTHPSNRGKALALKTALAAAAAAGYTHAVTIDTDGQLDPQDIPALLQVAAEHPKALIVGHRDENASDYPSRSRIGRRWSNMAVRLETGLRVADCQCGLRVYPLRLMEVIKCRMGRYAFETEIITRAAWGGCEVLDVPVSCRYFEGAQRVSHFRPWRDSLHGIALHLMLIGRSLVPWPHRPIWPEDVKAAAPWRKRMWRNVLSWMNPLDLWRQLRHDVEGRTSQAVGVGLGVFIATLPIYGLQTIACLYVSKRLHLHPLSVVAGSQLSMPPIGFFLIAGAVGLGHLILRGSLPSLDDYDLKDADLSQMAGELIVEWAVGGVILGFVLGVVFFGIFYFVFKFIAVDDAPKAEQAKDELAGEVRVQADQSIESL